MYHNPVNLLPPDRRRALRRGYFLRLTTVAVLLLSALVVVHGVMLIPAYLSARSERDAAAAELARVGGAGTDSSDAANTELTTLAASAKYLSGLGAVPSVAGPVRLILAVPRSGITLSSITSTAPANGKPATITLTGIAATRDTLRAYDVALTAVPGVQSVDLPISAYAVDADTTFTMTIAGTFQTP